MKIIYVSYIYRNEDWSEPRNNEYNEISCWPEFFFRSYFHFCLSSVHYCEDRFHIHSIILLYRIKEYQNLSRFKSLISSPRSELTIFIFTVIEINEMTILLSTWSSLFYWITSVKCNFLSDRSTFFITRGEFEVAFLPLSLRASISDTL